MSQFNDTSNWVPVGPATRGTRGMAKGAVLRWRVRDGGGSYVYGTWDGSKCAYVLTVRPSSCRLACPRSQCGTPKQIRARIVAAFATQRRPHILIPPPPPTTIRMTSDQTDGRRVLLGVCAGGRLEHVPVGDVEYNGVSAERAKCIAKVPAPLAPVVSLVSNIEDADRRAEVLAAVAATEAACNEHQRAASHLRKKNANPEADDKEMAARSLFGTIGGVLNAESVQLRLLLDGHYEAIQSGNENTEAGLFSGVIARVRSAAPFVVGLLGKLAGAMPARASYDACQSRVLDASESQHLYRVPPPHPPRTAPGPILFSHEAMCRMRRGLSGSF